MKSDKDSKPDASPEDEKPKHQGRELLGHSTAGSSDARVFDTGKDDDQHRTYDIYGVDGKGKESKVGEVKFSKGLRKPTEEQEKEQKFEPGVSIESLLAICKDRLCSFQDTGYRDPGNAQAIHSIDKALEGLNIRTANRLRLGIDGTNKVARGDSRDGVAEVGKIDRGATVV